MFPSTQSIQWRWKLSGTRGELSAHIRTYRPTLRQVYPVRKSFVQAFQLQFALQSHHLSLAILQEYPSESVAFFAHLFDEIVSNCNNYTPSYPSFIEIFLLFCNFFIFLRGDFRYGLIFLSAILFQRQEFFKSIPKKTLKKNPALINAGQKKVLDCRNRRIRSTIFFFAASCLTIHCFQVLKRMFKKLTFPPIIDFDKTFFMIIRYCRVLQLPNRQCPIQ